MRLVFLLCAAFALGVATGPEEMMNIPQNMQPEKKPDELLALMTETFEEEEIVPVVKEEGRMLGGFRQSRCPSGWSGFGSRCFIFVSRKMPWIDAEKYCVRNKANLASVHNIEEYRFIQDVVRQATGLFDKAWIGGTDAIKDRTWFWSDGSGFNFQHWATGEPNNINNNERCLEINRSEDHLWNDLACEIELPFICGTRP